MHMQKIKVLVVLTILVLLHAHSADADPIEVFSKDNPTKPSEKKCNKQAGRKPINIVRANSTKGEINWKYEKNSKSWCGWKLEAEPLDITKYLSGFLVIKFIGTYHGKSPEINLFDASGNDSSLIGFAEFMTGDPDTGAIVKIPLEVFGFNLKKPSFSNIDPTQFKVLQFNAEYDSKFGEITISYVGLEKLKTRKKK